MPMFHPGACAQPQITVCLDSLSSVKIQKCFTLAPVFCSSCQESIPESTAESKNVNTGRVFHCFADLGQHTCFCGVKQLFP